MRSGTLQTSLFCNSSGFPGLLLNNCRTWVDIFRNNNYWPEANISDKIICHVTCPFKFGKEPTNGFCNGLFCKIKFPLKTAEVTLILTCGISVPEKHIVQLNASPNPFSSVRLIPFTLQWSNGSFVACFTAATDSCTHHLAAFMSEFCWNFAYLFFFFRIWHLHTFRIVLRSVTSVRNGSINAALGLRVLFVCIAIAVPFDENFCNYIFRFLYKMYTVFPMNIKLNEM